MPCFALLCLALPCFALLCLALLCFALLCFARTMCAFGGQKPNPPFSPCLHRPRLFAGPARRLGVCRCPIAAPWTLKPLLESLPDAWRGVGRALWAGKQAQGSFVGCTEGVLPVPLLSHAHTPPQASLPAQLPQAGRQAGHTAAKASGRWHARKQANVHKCTSTHGFAQTNKLHIHK